MSSISKLSSRSSSSSAFSSIINGQFQPTLTLQTVLSIKLADINARAIFCGEQDFRLNELRRMTGAIIDLNVIQGTSSLFERVNWTISHRNTEVRDFVARRLDYWMQQTQIACDMAYDDALFSERKQIKDLPRPPPLSSANFSRRYRTRSLTQSEVPHFNSRRDSVPSTPLNSTYKPVQPFTGLLGRTLSNMDSQGIDRGRLLTPHKDRHRSTETYTNENIQISLVDIEQLMESAKCAGVLSDTSDNELNENRVCFADTVSVSKLAEILRNNELRVTSNLYEINNIIQQSTMNITTREQMRQFDGKIYWFHRVILDGHIQFPPGISQDSNEAQRLAYRHMIDVCLNEGGIKMKLLTGNRVKVVKGTKLDEHNCSNIDDTDMNATHISRADLLHLSLCNMVY